MSERRNRLALRALWITGIFLGTLLVFSPEPPLTVAQETSVRALQPAPSQEGELHNLRDGQDATSATLLAARGENALSFEDLIATKLGRRPPPVFTSRLHGLDGKTVRIRGFMAPYDSLNDLRTFMLMESPVGCYFCVPPSPKEVMLVRVKTDKIQDFVEPAIEVEGTLSIWTEDKTDEAHKMFLFLINDARITIVKETADVDRGDAY